MKKYFIGLILILSALWLGAQTIRIYKTDRIEERDGKQYYVHTVQQGQTVYSIAKTYEVSPDEIYFENPETKIGISIDQELWIPTINKETELNTEIKSTDFEFFYHIATADQNYSQLSAIYHIPEKNIRQANSGLFAPFRDGEYVKIPVDESIIEDADNKEVSFNPNLEVIPDYRHIVDQGETVYSISKKYNITVSSLRAVNPGLAITLEIGDRLRIPKARTIKKETGEQEIVDKLPQKTKPFKHRVRKKETLYSISRQYGVKIQEIYAENPGLTSNIFEGQVIKVPRTSLEKPFVIFTADRRTKLKKIAKLYNISIYSIQNENPSISTKVYPGQRIRIPVGKIALEQIEKEAEKVKEAEVNEEIAERPASCRKIHPHYEKQFKVALMIPLYLEEMDSIDFDQFIHEKQVGFYPFRYLEFYEGALIAIDSLKARGMNIEMFVYDVDQKLTKTAKVLQDSRLREMDMIIGPFHSKSFDQVAHFAGTFGIPIINPLSYRDKVANNYPTTIKVKSDRRQLVDLVPAIIPEYYPGHKVFLISHTSYKDADIVTNLANNLKSVIEPQKKLSNNDLYNLTVAVAHRDTTYTPDLPLPVINVEGLEIYPDIIESQIFDSTIVNNDLVRINYMRDSLHPFLDNASSLRKNLVILYGDSKAFMMDAMNRLNEHRDTFNIQLIGLPKIETFSNLDNTQANNMDLTYFSTSYIDYQSTYTNEFIRRFKAEYNTEPGIYGFSGYDVTYFFLSALFNLDDRISECLEHVPLDLILARYKFGKRTGYSNYQNTYWNLIRYDGYSRKKLPDPVVSIPD